MSKIIALVFLLAGAGLIWHGFQVRDSFKGQAQQISSDVKKSWNGEPEITDATWFMIGGGVLVVVGAAGVMKK
jgi:uncharacterized membrane protein YphA (DoxX/SURF4 family)